MQQLSGIIANTARCNQKSVIQDGGRQTGSKPKVFISALLDKIETLFQRLPHVFEDQKLGGIIANKARSNRMSVIQDGGRQIASKPEVVISPLLDKTATPFQRLLPHCVVQQLNGTIADTA